ncbi:hypothetical protein BD410DRAFT_791312 [Rickenella mellea]|uniref:Uncharacterized protein n=1 Tax=Rickenella mellea TaxID=50990 RepID=A0A4Y7PYI4_9AGAM|nr:hypothetical protein BD410DRAFT_791312 [Rickenella mellea]
MILPSAPPPNPPPAVPQESMGSQRQSWTLPFFRTIFTILSISISLSIIVSVLAAVNANYNNIIAFTCAGLTTVTISHHLAVYLIVRKSSDPPGKPRITRNLLTKPHIWLLWFLVSCWSGGAIFTLAVGRNILVMVDFVFMILEVMVLILLCAICIRGRKRFTKGSDCGGNGPDSTSSADSLPSFHHDPPPAYYSEPRGEELSRSTEKQLEGNYEDTKDANSMDSFSDVKSSEPRTFD